jgi:hypothetical protein
VARQAQSLGLRLYGLRLWDCTCRIDAQIFSCITLNCDMSHSGADFQEIISSQLPALHLLSTWGYSYLTPTQALEARGGKRGLPVLTQVLEANLKRLNQISYKGKPFDFTPENIRKGVDALANLPFESHLTTAHRLNR